MIAASLSLPGLPAPADAGQARPPTAVAAKGTFRAAPRYQGDIVLLRGFGDVFSRGLDVLGAELNRRGIAAHVISHDVWLSAARSIAANQRKYGHRPVVLIGHSLGGNDAIRIAQELKKSGVTVDYLVTFAATSPPPVPSNVRRVTNYYFKTGGWGVPLAKDNGFRGVMENVDYSGVAGIGHFNIEKQESLHKVVIRNVLRYVQPVRSAALSQ